MGSSKRLASRISARRWRGRVRHVPPAPRPRPAWASGAEFGGLAASVGYFALANTALAAGDAGAALDATAAAWEHGSVLPGFAAHLRPFGAQAALAGGDLIAARGWADDAVATATGWALLMPALSTRARVAIAQGEPEQAERDAHDALASVPEGRSAYGHFRHPGMPCHRGRRHRQLPGSGAAVRRGGGDPAAYGRGAVQGLGRGVRGVGRSAAKCDGRGRL